MIELAELFLDQDLQNKEFGQKHLLTEFYFVMGDKDYKLALAIPMSFIDYLEELNTVLIDAAYLKPTIMFAVMTKVKQNDRVQCYHHWTPEFCIRHQA